MKHQLLPRSSSVTDPVTLEERLPFPEEGPVDLPQRILAVTGPLTHRTVRSRERCILTAELENSNGDLFILEAAHGVCRSQELGLEWHVLQALQGSPVPVPSPLAFVHTGPSAFLLMEGVPGRPVNDVLREIAQSDNHRMIVAAAGALLAQIHRLPASLLPWSSCVKEQLTCAEHNLNRRIMSRAEFRAKGIRGDPRCELERLKATCPTPGTTVFLHGDFRPRNLLWNGECITAVLNWRGAGIGDPCFDLAAAFSYLEPDGQQTLLQAYGLDAVDPGRLDWFRTLAVYLMV